MQETRVYLIQNAHHYDKHHSLLNDDEFMDVAEEQGNVLTLPVFQEQFNSGELKVNSDKDVIRFIIIKN